MRAPWMRSRLLLLSAVLAVGIVAVVAVQLAQSRTAIWQRALAANTNLLFTVSHVLTHTLEAADRSLLHTVDVIETADRFLESAYLNNQGVGMAASSPVAGIGHSSLFPAMTVFALGPQLILDADGGVERSSSPFTIEGTGLSDRSYVDMHRYAAASQLHMSRSFVARDHGEPTVALSRRWNRADGSMGGIVVQTVKLSALDAVFRTITLGPDSGINVITTAGEILLRFPYTGEYRGQSLAGSLNFERFVREHEGHFTGVAAIDQVERLYAFRTLDDFPLILNIAQSTETILSGWRRSAYWMGGATLLLTLGCVALALYAERQLRGHRRTARRLEKAEHEMRVVFDSLLEEKERFRITLESIQDAVITTDRDGSIVYLNPAAARMTRVALRAASGRRIEEVLTIQPLRPQPGVPGSGTDAVPDSPLREVLATRRAMKSKGEHLLVSPDGVRTHIEDFASPILDGEGGVVGAVLVFHEVGRAREMAHRMSALAQHDALTGLLNRRAFLHHGAARLERARSESGMLACLYLDLDGFKQVNDRHGHGVGDELLLGVCGRLSSRLRDGDTLFRYGGDEFVVLLDALQSAADAEKLAQRLIDCCRPLFEVAGLELQVTLSVGISLFPEDANNLSSLVEMADMALYAAKARGRDCWVRAPQVSDTTCASEIT